MVTIVFIPNECANPATAERFESAQAPKPDWQQHTGNHPWQLWQIAKKLAALAAGPAERNHTQATIELGC
jgi:hypothetical protein